MERGSTQHAAELDDHMKKETEPIERGSPGDSRVEEHRLTEDTGREPDGLLDADEADARSLIARHLDRVVFPGTREELLEDAEANNAPPAVIRALRDLPSQARFENVQEIWIALGGEPEERF